MKPEVTAETNLGKKRKSPVPADYGRIVAGSLKLKLMERVELRNALNESIDAELKKMETDLIDAKKLNGG